MSNGKNRGFEVSKLRGQYHYRWRKYKLLRLESTWGGLFVSSSDFLSNCGDKMLLIRHTASVCLIQSLLRFFDGGRLYPLRIRYWPNSVCCSFLRTEQKKWKRALHVTRGHKLLIKNCDMGISANPVKGTRQESSCWLMSFGYAMNIQVYHTIWYIILPWSLAWTIVVPCRPNWRWNLGVWRCGVTAGHVVVPR